MKVLDCVLLAALALASVAGRASGEDDAESRKAAVASAKTVVADARKAKQGHPDAQKALKAARASLEPFMGDARAALKSGSRADAAGWFFLTKLWNELLTVSAYHGLSVKGAYALRSDEILWKRYLLGLPANEAWSWRYNADSKNNDQLHMFVDQMRPNGKPLRRIKVWTYRWDTVYSGVGGENYKGLAKMMHEVDRDSTAKTKRKSSPAVTARKLNGEFSRVYYYFVEGFDVDAEQTLRRDNYYMKGDNLSFNFEVISYLDPTEGDDEVTKWQCGESDPEIEAVLESLAANPNYVKKK